MAEYGIADIGISFDDSGGTPQDVTSYVMTINGFEVEAVMEESTAFGKSWRESLGTGLRFVPNIVLGGIYNTVVVPYFKAVVSGPSVASRTFALTYGGTDSSSVETNIQKFGRKPGRGLTKYETTLEPTGAVTEA